MHAHKISYSEGGGNNCDDNKRGKRRTLKQKRLRNRLIRLCSEHILIILTNGLMKSVCVSRKERYKCTTSGIEHISIQSIMLRYNIAQLKLLNLVLVV